MSDNAASFTKLLASGKLKFTDPDGKVWVLCDNPVTKSLSKGTFKFMISCDGVPLPITLTSNCVFCQVVNGKSTHCVSGSLKYFCRYCLSNPGLRTQLYSSGLMKMCSVDGCLICQDYTNYLMDQKKTSDQKARDASAKKQAAAIAAWKAKNNQSTSSSASSSLAARPPIRSKRPTAPSTVDRSSDSQ